MFHSGEQQQLSCNFCTFQTIHKGVLKRHEGTVHKNDKTIKEDAQYNCNICQYSTAEKGYLSNHIKSQHIYERFFCNICDYESTQKSHLSTHTKNVHRLKNVHWFYQKILLNVTCCYSEKRTKIL